MLSAFLSAALYPTLAPDVISFILAHSGARAVLLGKLDGWESQATGIPKGIPCISFPHSPAEGFTRWDDVVKSQHPLQGDIARHPDLLQPLRGASATLPCETRQKQRSQAMGTGCSQRPPPS